MAIDARLIEAARLETYGFEAASGEDPDYELSDSYSDDAWALRREVRDERLSATWHGRLALRLERWARIPFAWDRAVWGVHWGLSGWLQDSSHMYSWCWRLAFATLAKDAAGWVNFTLVWRVILREPTRMPAWQRATLDKVDILAQGWWWTAMDCLRGEGCPHNCPGTFADTRRRRWWRLDGLSTPLLALARRLGGPDFILPII